MCSSGVVISSSFLLVSRFQGVSSSLDGHGFLSNLKGNEVQRQSRGRCSPWSINGCLLNDDDLRTGHGSRGVAGYLNI